MTDTRADIARIAKGGSLNLVGSVVAQASALAVTLLIGRRLGEHALGIYAQVFAFLPLLGLLSLAGFRAGMTRFVAMYRAGGDDAAVVGTVRFGLACSIASGFILAACLYATAAPMSRLLDDPALQNPLRIAACALPFSVLGEAARSATQGFGTMRYFAGIGLIVEPLLRALLTVVLVYAGFGINGAVFALLVSNAVAAVAACTAITRMLPRVTGRVRYPVRQIFSFSMVSWVASLASTGLTYLDVLLIGFFMSSADVGIYQVATRVVLLAYATMLPVVQAVSPQFAHAYGRRDFARLGETYRVATGWIVRTSLPVFVVLIAFPGDVLRIFGDEFAAGVAVTVILAVGKLVDAASGPCGLVLNMAGRVRTSMVDNIAALVASVVLDIVLIPRHGLVGAAIAWAVTLAAVNVARVIQVRAAFGFQPYDRSVWGSVLWAAVALTLVLAGRAVGLDPPLPAGVAIAFGAYFAHYALIGVPEEDAIALRALLRRHSLAADDVR